MNKKKKYNNIDNIINSNEYSFGGDLLKALGFNDIKNSFSGTNIGNTIKNNAGLFGTTVGQIGNNIIGGNLNSGVGNTISGLGNTVGGLVSHVNPLVGGIISAGSGIIGGLTNKMFGSKLNDENIANIESNNTNIANTSVGIGSFDNIGNQWTSQDFGKEFTQSDIGSDGWFSNKAKNKFIELQNQQKSARNNLLTSYNNAIEATDSLNDINRISNIQAYGGPINMNYTGLMSPFGNRFKCGGKMAFGGELGTNGADFTNGLLNINNGGTHEENINNGVPINMNENGEPNLVEEGETVFNNYVFSKRLKPNKKVLNELGLPINYNNYSFADISKKLSKESEERPNDPISRNGLLDSMNKLMVAQESIKRNKANNSNTFAEGGDTKKRMILGNDGIMYDANADWINNNTLTPFNYLTQEPIITGSRKINMHMGKINGANIPYSLEALNSKPYNNITFNFPYEISTTALDDTFPNTKKINSNPTIFSNQPNNDVIDINHDRTNIPNMIVDTDLPSYMNWNKDNTTWQGIDNINNAMQPKNSNIDAPLNSNANNLNGVSISDNILSNADISTPKVRSINDVNINNDVTSTSKYKPESTWLRYMPVVGSAIGLAQNMLSKPDYSASDTILDAANNSGKYQAVSYTPIGGYINPKLLDTNYYLNRLDSQANSTKNAIMNTSNPNRNAALLAADYNAQNSYGDLMRKAEEYNDVNRLKAAEFNKGINMINSEMGLKAAMSNQQALANSKNARLLGIEQAMAIRNNIDNARNASLSANFTNLFNSLGNIGKEAYTRNMINSNPAFLYFINKQGINNYKQ